MRIILSRKGFDSSAGGMPSPIFPDGRLCSLPIPVTQNDGLSFDDVTFDGATIGAITDSLSGRSRPEKLKFAHLDPDLRWDSRPRQLGWLPAFGQSEAAARHLDKQGVSVGDLFIFFGWFRRTIATPNGLRFEPGAPDLHVIFGWLQVGDIRYPNEDGRTIPPWLRDHPHVSGETAKLPHNTIYIANPALEIDGLEAWPGGGVFGRNSDALTLTASGQLRSKWRLPLWFYGDGTPRLSYHGKKARWELDKNEVRLDTVGRGQEFVIDVGDDEEPLQWIRGLFNAAYF